MTEDQKNSLMTIFMGIRAFSNKESALRAFKTYVRYTYPDNTEKEMEELEQLIQSLENKNISLP